MGAPPATHHTTHENGGMDPVDLTGMTGLTGTPQTPATHATTHEDGGADPITISHGDLTGLADDDHQQYRLRHEVHYKNDCFHPVSYQTPWAISGVAGGIYDIVTNAGPLHPGVLYFRSSTNSNSGIAFWFTPNVRLGGGETSTCWHRPKTLALTTRHHGFHDTTTVADPVDGAWIWQDPATGIIYGRTMNNSAGSTTGTGYQLVTDTWYCEKIVVNADASQVDFYCYAEDGTELWHDSLTTNIPTAAGDEVGHGVVVTNSGTTAVTLDDVDYLSILIPDRRPNV